MNNNGSCALGVARVLYEVVSNSVGGTVCQSPDFIISTTSTKYWLCRKTGFGDAASSQPVWVMQMEGPVDQSIMHVTVRLFSPLRRTVSRQSKLLWIAGQWYERGEPSSWYIPATCWDVRWRWSGRRTFINFEPFSPLHLKYFLKVLFLLFPLTKSPIYTFHSNSCGG